MMCKNNIPDVLFIRGHHLCCGICFLGSGKSTAIDFFGVDNSIPWLVDKMFDSPDQIIIVSDTFDDVCNKCPLKSDKGCNRSTDVESQNKKLESWDREILARLGLKPGHSITVSELIRLIRLNIPDIGEICTNCSSSLPYGFANYKRGLEIIERRFGLG